MGRRWSNIIDYKIVAWWKHDNLLMSFNQLIDSGRMGGTGQMKLWIKGKLR